MVSRVLRVVGRLPGLLFSYEDGVSTFLLNIGELVTTAWRVLRLRMEETPSSFGG
jgi:hypothetical protein